MTVKITGFADEIAPELTAQIAGLKGLGMSYVEMRGVDGENLIYHTDEKVEQIKKTLDDNGIRLSALGSPLGKILITDDFTPHFEEFKMKKISMEQWLWNAKNSWIPFTGIILKLFLTLPTLYSADRIRWKPMRC